MAALRNARQGHSQVGRRRAMARQGPAQPSKGAAARRAVSPTLQRQSEAPLGNAQRRRCPAARTLAKQGRRRAESRAATPCRAKAGQKHGAVTLRQTWHGNGSAMQLRSAIHLSVAMTKRGLVQPSKGTAKYCIVLQEQGEVAQAPA